MKAATELPHFGNLDPFQNRVSAAAAEGRFLVNRTPGIAVDRLHGHAWGFNLDAGDAVYGRTESFPDGPLDSLAHGTFLRVPYRRIPRIPVSSMDELRSFASSVRSHDSSISVMWRGQNAIHTLRSRRSDEELLQFYGTTDVIEPSLLPSATRGAIDIESYTPAWFGLLDVLIDELHARGRFGHGEEIAKELELDGTVLRQNYAFRQWAFGVAQHYGLPSTGLDLSPDLDVATFFALHKFTIARGGQTTISRIHPDSEPVVFLMSVFEGDLLSDRAIAPPHLMTPRAFAQKAHFFRTAWGAAPNRAAERIVAVIDLVNHEEWNLAVSDETLFPTIAADPFAHFLHQAQTRFPKIASTVPLQSVYFTT